MNKKVIPYFAKCGLIVVIIILLGIFATQVKDIDLSSKHGPEFFFSLMLTILPLIMAAMIALYFAPKS